MNDVQAQSQRILIAEDDPIVARDIQETVEGLGYGVSRVVHTGGEAVSSALEDRPELALLDIRMPGELDGIQAGRQLMFRLGVPVIYLTAYADDETLGRAVEFGPFGYVKKPFEPQELKAAIEVGLHRSWMERRLRTSERRFAATLRSIGEAVVATNSRGRITLMNPTAEAMTGVSQDEATGQKAEDVVRLFKDVSGVGIDSPIRHALENESPVRLDDGIVLRSADGREFPVSDSASPIIGDEGELLGAVLVFRDETERERRERELADLQEQLLHSQKMDALGRLAGGVAHDFNNILTGILGYANLSLDRDDLDEELEADLKEIRRGAERAAALAGQLLTVSRKEVTQTKPVDPAEVVDGVTPLLERILGERMTIVKNVSSGAGIVEIDPNRLEQVLLNLSVNAAQAMPDGGRIAIETGTVRSDASARLRDTFGPPARDVYYVSVTDEGVGMSEETLSHLFEPFFTTKESGTGLGLATSYGIIAAAGGTLDAESTPGEGTTMTVYLPLIED